MRFYVIFCVLLFAAADARAESRQTPAQPLTCASHQYFNAFGNNATFSCAQPSASDVSGLAAVATSGSASDLSAGTLGAARLPAFSGDASSTSGSSTLALATVNSNTGSFGSSTAIPNFTVNGKGLITGAGTNAVIAPAGTLTGSTLASGVTASSLTGLGTLSSLTVNGTETFSNLTGSTQCLHVNSSGVLSGTGSDCGSGSGSSPGGSTNSLQYNAGSGMFGGISVSDAQILIGTSGAAPNAKSLSGDCSLTDVGAITCTKTSGTSFGSLSTLNTVNNANWSGTALSVANGGTGTGSPGLVAGTNISVGGSWPNQTIADTFAQAYPGSGIANSTGSAWGTSYTTSGSGTVVALATSPSFTTPSLGSATATGLIITSTSANALAAGANGATNPVFNVDASASSVASGITVKGAATGGTTTITATDSGSNSSLDMEAKGTGAITIGGTSTGNNTLGNNSGGVVYLKTSGSNSINLQQNNNTRLQITAQGRFVFSSGTNNTASNYPLTYTYPADTTLTTLANAVVENHAGNGVTRQHAAGTIPLQTDIVLSGTTDSFASSSTLTYGSTLNVQPKSCGTNGSCTTMSAIYIGTAVPAGTSTAAGSFALSGTVTNSIGIDIWGTSGATNNYALITESGAGNVGIGTATPLALLHVNGGAVVDAPSTLTISTSTFTPVAVGANTYRVVLVHASCPCTIANPSGTAVDGQKFILEIWQSSTGSDTIGTWGSNYDFGTTGSPTLSTGASKGDFIGFSYSAQNSKYNFIGITQGM